MGFPSARQEAALRCTEDRRVYHCSITQEGLALLASMDAAVYDVDEAAIGPLLPDQVDQLVRLLRTILDSRF